MCVAGGGCEEEVEVEEEGVVFDCLTVGISVVSVSPELPTRPHSVPGSENNLKTIEKFYRTFSPPSLSSFISPGIIFGLLLSLLAFCLG